MVKDREGSGEEGRRREKGENRRGEALLSSLGAMRSAHRSRNVALRLARSMGRERLADAATTRRPGPDLRKEKTRTCSKGMLQVTLQEINLRPRREGEESAQQEVTAYWEVDLYFWVGVVCSAGGFIPTKLRKPEPLFFSMPTTTNRSP